MRFWVHIDDKGDLLDGGGYPAEMEKPSEKATVWTSKDAVLAFCKRKFKGESVRDLGARIEVDLPSNAFFPARTLAFVEMDTGAAP